MRALTILYDARCELCCRIKVWLNQQPKYIDLAFLPAGSEEARYRFPQLDHEPTLNDLTVISDQGAVYYGSKAWVMVLWALGRYREWSYRLATPELLPTVRRIVSLISQHRYQISRVAGLTR